MKQIIFDFDSIKNMADFYKEAAAELQLPDYFGNNLDALWDCVTAEIELPVKITFVNLAPEQLEKNKQLIELFEDAETELGEDNLSFGYYLKDEYGDFTED